MSLEIEVDDIVEVLLADGWHAVADKSFVLDAYEFVNDRDSRGNAVVLHGGGDSGITAIGFAFKEDGGRGGEVFGPLTAILAVRTE